MLRGGSIVPQAMRIVIPPVTNDFIALFKDTSVCTMISVVELTGQYRKLFNDHPQLMLEFGLITVMRGRDMGGTCFFSVDGA